MKIIFELVLKVLILKFCNPLKDTVKTRVQAFPHLYKNSFHCCLKIVKNEGPRALGKGLLPPVLAQAGMNSVLFASEGTVRRSLEVIYSYIT